MPQVINLDITSGDGDGSVVLKWKFIYGASTYQIQISEDDTTFRPEISTTRSRKNVVENLTMAWYYTFRVAAVGAAGRDPWSDT
jgi:hypothetical protein